MADYGIKRQKNTISGNLDLLDLDVNPKGWFVGNFIKEIPEFKNDDFEIKWGNHKKGFVRNNVKTPASKKTILLLINGKARLDLPDDEISVILENTGDYLYFDTKDSEHNFEALEDTLIITFRWPSK